MAGACPVWAIAMRECSMRAAVRTDGVMCSMPAGLGCHFFLFLFDDVDCRYTMRMCPKLMFLILF